MRPSICLALCAITFPAYAADVVVGDDFEINYQAPDGWVNAYGPVAGYNGTDFMALWEDNWSGCDTQTCEWDVDSKHISLGGTVVLGPTAVGDGPGEQCDPAIALGEDRSMAVWVEMAGGDGGLFAVPMGSGGIPLLGPTRIAEAESYSADPAVAWTGDTFLVAWHSDAGDIEAIRVDAGGIPVDADPISVASEPGEEWHPRVACAEESCLVVWDDWSQVLGRRVRSSDGVVLDDDPIVIGAQGRDPAIAWDGTRYLVVWTNNGIVGTHVEADGTVPFYGGVGIRGGGGSNPDVVSLDPGFLVVYAESRPEEGEDPHRWGWYGIYGMRIDPDGNTVDNGTPGVLGSGSFLIANDPTRLQWHPRIAGGNGDYLVVWIDSEDWDTVWTTQGVFGAVLEVPPWDDPEGDTGDTGSDPGDDDERRGCTTGGGPSTLWWPLALLALAVRRRATRADS